MRLIGIQALLPLLPHRTEAIADASGIGSTVAVSNAGAIGTASGFGSANGNLIGIPNPTAQAHGTGVATAVGFATGVVASTAASAGIGSSAMVGFAGGPVNAFLARTSGLDATHVNAYTDLINGLNTDGVWSKLDVLYIFATANSTTALLNLVSTGFTGITHGSPSFAADRGFTGVDASSTVYIDSQFNPSTAGGHFATNSCHVSAWADTAVTPTSGGGVIIGQAGASGNNQTAIYPKFSDGNTYVRINDSANNLGGGPNAGTSVGHWLISRTGATTSVAYKNGSLNYSPNSTSGTLANNNMYILASNANGTTQFGSACQITAASIGGGLNATDANNLYSRLRTYMTAMGVP